MIVVPPPLELYSGTEIIRYPILLTVEIRISLLTVQEITRKPIHEKPAYRFSPFPALFNASLNATPLSSRFDLFNFVYAKRAFHPYL